MKMKRFSFIFSVLLFVVACGNDTYDAGDGVLSYLRADFADVRTDASARLFSVVTDDDERFLLSPPVESGWAITPDSVYRALVYYDSNAVSGDAEELPSVRPIAISRVLVPRILSIGELETPPSTDPLTLVGAWKSKNGKYINIELSVKTGTPEAEDAGHILGIVFNGVTDNADGGKTANVMLTHKRKDMPEYYSVSVYVSVPVKDVPGGLVIGDSIAVTVNTYDGQKTKTFLFDR